MNTKIFHPLGMMRGCESDFRRVLGLLSLEMFAHRSDLREAARRAEDAAEQQTNNAIADVLERYATALTICTHQLMSDDELQRSDISGLLELSQTHNLYLSETLRQKAALDKAIFGEKQ